MSSTTKKPEVGMTEVSLRGRRQTKKTPRRGLTDQQEFAVRRLLEMDEYDYTNNEVFTKRNAHKLLFDDAPEIAKPDTSWYHPLMDSNSDAVARNAKISSAPLTAAQERALFLQFNYCRFRAARVHAQLVAKRNTKRLPVKLSRELLEWNDKAEHYRDQIAQTNLALVLAMAKRIRMTDMDFGDMVSEGNMALLRAIDKFDVARGFKFSTYACRAILKGFSRMGMKHTRYKTMFPTDFDPSMERSDHADRKREEHRDDCVDEIRVILTQNRAELTQIEQEVIGHRFNVGPEKPSEEEGKPMTLEQVGKIIGVTKERVRQIQNKALAKIKNSMEDDFLK